MLCNEENVLFDCGNRVRVDKNAKPACMLPHMLTVA